MYGKIKRIHFTGIGGIGMSGIAEVLLNLGYQVSGSDLRESEATRRLTGLGGEIEIGHAANNVAGADVVVTSTAIRQGNAEVDEANRLLIPVIPRAEMLAELMRMKYGIAVAGTHGKTTTTSMVATVLTHAGIDPTAVIGGRLNAFGSNAKLGQGKFLVAEADESDGSFLKLSPTLAVVTNIDEDHLDFYSDIEEIRDTFVSFINKIPFYGVAAICLDDPNVQEIIPRIEKRFVTYGLSSQATFQATDIQHQSGESSFTCIFNGESLGEIKFAMPGEHNVLNALAAVAIAHELQIPFETIAEGFATFGGVQRRFQIKHSCDQLMVVDDYGHHPAEIKATLAAARSGWDKRVVAVFQPHRYSRTSALLEEFSTAFYHADHLVITDVYAAGEQPIAGADSARLADMANEHGHRSVHYAASKEDVIEHLLETIRDGDMVITLGAGNVWQYGEEFAKAFNDQSN